MKSYAGLSHTGIDAADAEPLDEPLRQSEVLQDAGRILAVLLAAAALTNLCLILQGAV